MGNRKIKIFLELNFYYTAVDSFNLLKNLLLYVGNAMIVMSIKG